MITSFWQIILYRIPIIGGSGSVKINSLLNLIRQQPDIDKIHFYARYPYEEKKLQFLISKQQGKDLVKQKHTLLKVKHFNDSKAFIAYSNDMSRIYKNIEKYNQVKKRKTLICFDDKSANELTNKKLNPVVTELYIRARKLTISLAFTSQSYFGTTKKY